MCAPAAYYCKIGPIQQNDQLIIYLHFLTKAERAYDSNQREALAIAWSVFPVCKSLKITRLIIQTNNDFLWWTLSLADAIETPWHCGDSVNVKLTLSSCSTLVPSTKELMSCHCSSQMLPTVHHGKTSFQFWWLEVVEKWMTKLSSTFSRRPGRSHSRNLLLILKV